MHIIELPGSALVGDSSRSMKMNSVMQTRVAVFLSNINAHFKQSGDIFLGKGGSSICISVCNFLAVIKINIAPCFSLRLEYMEQLSFVKCTH